MRNLRSRRAILLLSVLFFCVLVTMFVGAAVALAPYRLANTQSDLASDCADRAAKSGVEWASSRLSSIPTWNAKAAQTFSAPGIYVTEGSGLVTGWFQQNDGWSRFRIRFNYQDGPSSSASNSDNLDDPPGGQMWSDFPYVSCNNLLGGGTRQAPLARNGIAYSNAVPWPSSLNQLSVPNGTALLSVEGSTASGLVFDSGHPSDFTGNVHTKTVQTLVEFGNNQPLPGAVIMAAGDVSATLFAPNGRIALSSTTGETARMRTKTSFNIPGITSSNGDLRYGSGSQSLGVMSPGITQELDGTTPFYQLPATAVRAPQSPIPLAAGVYIVNNNLTGTAATVSYIPMNYADYLASNPLPVGTPITLPVGMVLSPPNASAPKYRLTVQSDVNIVPALGGAVHDFALIPDGGAPQSSTYAGGTALSSSDVAAGSVMWAAGLSFIGSNISGNGLNAALTAAWQAVLVSKFSFPGTAAYGGGFYTNYNLTGSGGMSAPWVGFPPPIHPNYPIYSLGTTLANFESNFTAAQIQTLANAYLGSAGSQTATTLAPKDLLLDLQATGSSGLMFANSHGDVVLGSQVQGHGAAVTSSHDIALIGTSTEFIPGGSLSLSLYAQNRVTIDAYRLDASGASFHGIDMQGVIYAWNGIDILAGNSTVSAPFTLKGMMVAYGGDPTSIHPVIGSAPTVINASTATLQYDPDFMTVLSASGPYTLESLSWHEF